MRATLPGHAGQMGRKMPMGRLPMGKSFSLWRCFLLPIDGETEKESMRMRGKQEKFCVRACIKGSRAGRSRIHLIICLIFTNCFLYGHMRKTAFFGKKRRGQAENIWRLPAIQ